MPANPSATSGGNGPPPTGRSPHRRAVYLALVALTGVVIFAGMHAVPLTDPDEVFYAGTAKEMLEDGSLLTPVLFGHPNFEKPPLIYWLLMVSFQVFGAHPASARLVPALFGLLGVFLTYRFARRIVPEGTASLAALILATGTLYLGQSIALLTDMMFSVLVAASLYCFYRWFSERHGVWLHLFGATLGLAVLAKGPVGFVIALVASALFLRLAGDNAALRRFLIHPWWLVFAAVAGPWYAYATTTYGRTFTWEFFVHDNWHRILRAEHGNLDTFWFYPVLVVVGVFPWTAFLSYIGGSFRRHRTPVLFLGSWVLTTWAIFALAHSKLPSYILPLLPALAISQAISLESPERRRRAAACAAAVFFVLGIGMLTVPWLVRGPHAVELQPILLAIAALGATQVVAGTLVLARRVAGAIIVNAAGFLAAMLVGCLTVPPSVADGFTDAGTPAIVAKEGLGGEAILTSKYYVRGVHYATGAPVVVMAAGAQPFWSPHPVEVLWRDDQIRAFFDAKEKVLCVVRENDLERLNRLLGGSRTNRVLSSAFDRQVVLSLRR